MNAPVNLRQIVEAEIEIEHRTAACGDGELLGLAIAQHARRHTTVGLDLAHDAHDLARRLVSGDRRAVDRDDDVTRADAGFRCRPSGRDLAHARTAGIARGLELHADDGVAGADRGHDLLHGGSAELSGKTRHFARSLLQAALRLLEPPIELGIVGPDRRRGWGGRGRRCGWGWRSGGHRIGGHEYRREGAARVAPNIRAASDGDLLVFTFAPVRKVQGVAAARVSA